MILQAFGDLLKHYIQVNYLTFDDAKTNALVYTLLSALVGYLVVVLSDVTNIKENIIWFLSYKIFGKKTMIPIITSRTKTTFKEKKVENLKSYISITREDEEILCSVFNRLIAGHCYSSIFSDKHRAITIYELDNLFNYLKPCKNSGMFRNMCIVAYVDGYEIYFVVTSSGYYFVSQDDAANAKYIDFLKQEYEKFKGEERKATGKIYCYDSKNSVVNIGVFNKHMTFDSYISRHKETIFNKVKSLKEGAYENKAYSNKNLGILLHGSYGTGKSTLAVVIANYLERSIWNVSSHNLKSKECFRKMFTQDNCKKYVFVFDEIDYLLTDLFTKKESSVRISEMVGSLKGENIEENIKKIKSVIEQQSSDVMTFEFFLSELSGINYVEGRVIIATTNFVDKIPRSLIRPGRFDLEVNFDNFNSDEIKEFLSVYYKPTERQKKLLERTKFPCGEYSPAELVSIALENSDFEDVVSKLKQR